MFEGFSMPLGRSTDKASSPDFATLQAFHIYVVIFKAPCLELRTRDGRRALLDSTSKVDGTSEARSQRMMRKIRAVTT